MVGSGIHDEVDTQQRETVLWACFVDISEVDAESPFRTSCIEPKGNTFSPENPRKWVLTGSSLSLLMSILSKAYVKMMLAELPLSTRTRWTVLLATTALITKGLS